MSVSGSEIIVVGMGPGPEGLLCEKAIEALFGAAEVCFRTLRHPGAQDLRHELSERGIVVSDFDYLYEDGTNFEEVYGAIVDSLVLKATERSSKGYICYVLPGSGSFGERTVGLLTKIDGVSVKVVPGVSFLELAFLRLGVDPVDGLCIGDGMTAISYPERFSGKVILAQCYSTEICQELLLRTSLYGEFPPPVLLHHLGLSDEVVAELKHWKLPEGFEPDHLTSLYFPLFSRYSTSLGRLWEVIRSLRTLCPWDAEQTHSSLARHLLEESHETLEALDDLQRVGEEGLNDAMAHLAEELGDLLIQVMFHANLAMEAGFFDLGDVADVTVEKLIRRHPHVFSDTVALKASDVVSNWEQIKLEEKSRSSVLEGIAATLPSIARAQKLLRKYRALGGVLPSRSSIVELLSNSVEHLANPLDQVVESELLELLVSGLVALSDRTSFDMEASLRRYCREIEGLIIALEDDLSRA